MAQETNFNDLLQLIDKENDKLTSEFYIPSLQKNIRLKTLNANHSKNILKSAIDGVFAANQFNLVMYNVISDIIEDKSLLNTITTYDKIFILLQLRDYNISKSINVSLSNADASKEIKNDIFINWIIKETDKKSMPVGFNVEVGNFTVALNYPTLAEEFAFDSNLNKTKIGKVDEKDQKAIKGLFGSFFIYNVTQYVKEIKINDIIVNLQDKTVDQRLAVVEKLPANVLDKIISNIDKKLATPLNKITRITKIIDDQSYTGEVEIGASLFIN